MKKIINRPEEFVDDVMDGIIAAYSDKVNFYNGDKRILIKSTPTPNGKVGIVTGGGSGHLPVFLGYVGEGMLDACSVGNVFASPSAQKMFGSIMASNYGSGVLCLFGNYGGDNMNFDMACEMAEFEDVHTRIVRVSDDVASSPKETMEKRRGVAGMVYAFKIAGAAAQKMLSLDEVANITTRALSNIRTMGLATSPCIVPEVGKPTFTIEDDKIEIGMGIHGEPGIEVKAMMTAKEATKTILDRLIPDLELAKGDQVSVMVNGLGATPMEELLIVYKEVVTILKQYDVKIFMPHIGEFATSMEMGGLSITLFRLDEELKELLESVASTPFYTNYNK